MSLLFYSATNPFAWQLSNSIILFVFATVLTTSFAAMIVLMLIAYKRHQGQTALERQQVAYEHQTELLKNTIETREETMEQVAEEIHDGIGQMLGITQLQISDLQQYIPTADGRDLLDRGLRSLRQAMSGLRSLSHSLHSALITEQGLSDVMKAEVERLGTRHIKNTFEVRGTPVPVTPQSALASFRVMQEAMHNAIKHADATHLVVTLAYESFLLRLIVQDDGTGFDIDAAEQQGTLGISNMMRRATAVGGNIRFERAQRGGTRVILTIPLETPIE